MYPGHEQLVDFNLKVSCSLDESLSDLVRRICNKTSTPRIAISQHLLFTSFFNLLRMRNRDQTSQDSFTLNHNK